MLLDPKDLSFIVSEGEDIAIEGDLLLFSVDVFPQSGTAVVATAKDGSGGDLVAKMEPVNGQEHKAYLQPTYPLYLRRGLYVTFDAAIHSCLAQYIFYPDFCHCRVYKLA